MAGPATWAFLFVIVQQFLGISYFQKAGGTLYGNQHNGETFQRLFTNFLKGNYKFIIIYAGNNGRLRFLRRVEVSLQLRLQILFSCSSCDVGEVQTRRPGSTEISVRLLSTKLFSTSRKLLLCNLTSQEKIGIFSFGL